MARRLPYISSRVLILLFLVSTVALSVLNGQTAQDARADCTKEQLPSDDHPRFFRIDPDNFGPSGPDTIRRYACFLRAVGEAPLLERSAENGSEDFRLLVIPTLRPPFMVRLTIRSDGAGELTAKAGESQRNPSVLMLDRETNVSKEEVSEFLKLVDQAKFWSMQTNQFYTKDDVAKARAFPPKRKKAERMVFDGVHWVLEGVQAGNYHVVTRTSPEPGPYAKLTSYLFQTLGKLEIPTYVEPPLRSR